MPKKGKITEKQKELLKKMIELSKEKQEGESKEIPGMGNISGVELLQKIQQMQKEMEKHGTKQTAGDILKEREIRVLNDYSVKVVQKFGRYIKAIVAFGSTTKKTATSDIDVAVLVDDTDVTRMGREELKDKLFQRLVEVAYVTDKKIHPQPYLLTEFWEYVRHGNPVLYNVLKTGVPLYDTGFFLPVQMIFKQGLIAPSHESVDRHILLSGKLLQMTEEMLWKKIIYNLEQTVVAAAQAILMEFGYRPPAPREVPEFLQRLVEQKALSDKWPKIVEEIILKYKAIEHETLKKVEGKELDRYLENAREFVEEMEKLLKKEREKKGHTYKFQIFEEEEKKKVKREGLIDIEEKKAESGEESKKLIEEELGQR